MTINLDDYCDHIVQILLLLHSAQNSSVFMIDFSHPFCLIYTITVLLLCNCIYVHIVVYEFIYMHIYIELHMKIYVYVYDYI